MKHKSSLLLKITLTLGVALIVVLLFWWLTEYNFKKISEPVRKMSDPYPPVALVNTIFKDVIKLDILQRTLSGQVNSQVLDSFFNHAEKIGSDLDKLGTLVNGNPDQAASAERMAGFYAAVREFEGVETYIAQGDFSFASGLSAAEQLLDRSPAPTAIFASNDDMAAAVVSVAHRRHLDVPKQLSVVGFDDTVTAVTLWPPLTTVHQPVHKLAAEALRLLAAGVSARGELPQPTAQLLDFKIIHRQSVAPPFD